MANDVHHTLPLGRWNWILGAAGLLAIVSGYVLLSVPPVDGFLSLTLAPFLLVGGYCVLIPAAIMAGGKRGPDPDASASGETEN